ncbi:unnamed protein product, partial [Polarella glacialis]
QRPLFGGKEDENSEKPPMSNNTGRTVRFGDSSDEPVVLSSAAELFAASADEVAREAAKGSAEKPSRRTDVRRPSISVFNVKSSKEEFKPKVSPRGEILLREDVQSHQKDHVLCAIYREMEVFGYFPISPVKLQGGCSQTELFQVAQDALQGILSRYPEKTREFEAKGRKSCQELAEAATSTEFTTRLPGQEGPRALRLKGMIVFNRAATDVREIPKEVFDENEDESAREHDDTAKYATKRWDEKLKTVVMDSETDKDILARWVIPPGCKAKVLWDLLLGFLIVYSVLAITFRFSFETEVSLPMTVVDAVVDIFFLGDMICSWRTAFLDQDSLLVTIPWELRRSYFKGWFLIDFLSTFPIDRIVE